MAASAPETLAFGARGPIDREDLSGLCVRARPRLAECRGATVLSDVGGVAADRVTVAALARLQLAARRHGCQLRLRNASAALRQLVAFMGLADVLPDDR